MSKLIGKCCCERGNEMRMRQGTAFQAEGTAGVKAQTCGFRERLRRAGVWGMKEE